MVTVPIHQSGAHSNHPPVTEPLLPWSATQELFVEHLIQEIYSHHPKASELNYAGLADVVQTQDSLEFLKGEALTCEVTPSAVLTRHLWMQKWSRERSPSRSSTG